ncbi:MAG TPA: hypothetical protein VGD02_02785 [Gemmatimonadaceae bacterium]|jgi:hypothetical protein
MSGAKRVAWILSLAVLAFTGILGIYNGVTEWRDVRTVFQQSVTAGVFVYGVLGLAAFVGLLRREPWAVLVTLAYAVVVTYVAGGAVMAYGDADASVAAALAAGAGTAVIAAAIVWIASATTRRS